MNALTKTEKIELLQYVGVTSEDDMFDKLKAMNRAEFQIFLKKMPNHLYDVVYSRSRSANDLNRQELHQSLGTTSDIALQLALKKITRNITLTEAEAQLVKLNTDLSAADVAGIHEVLETSVPKHNAGKLT